MAAPTLDLQVDHMATPAAPCPVRADIGFYRSRQLVTGVQWTQSTANASEYYLEASGGGDPSSAIDASFAEAVVVLGNGTNNNNNAMIELESGTLGSLSVDEWAWGDNDSLGFDTVYIRSSTTPATTQARYLIYHAASTGDAHGPEKGKFEWWVEDASGGVGPVLSSFNSVTDPRGAFSEAFTVAQASTSDAPKWPAMGFMAVLDQGAAVVKCKFTNASGESTTVSYTFNAGGDAAAVIANNRTTYSVGADGGDDYADLESLISDLETDDDVHVTFSGNASETLSATATPMHIKGDRWYIEGTHTLVQNATNARMLRFNEISDLVIDGLTFTPSETEGADVFDPFKPNAARLCIRTTVNGEAGVGNNRFDNICGTAGCNGLLFRVSCPAYGEYGLNVQSLFDFSPVTDAQQISTDHYAFGCDFGLSDNESAIRWTGRMVRGGAILCDLTEDSKDNIRSTVSTGSVFAWNNLEDGSIRLGESGEDYHRTRGCIVDGNKIVQDSGTTSVLPAIIVRPNTVNSVIRSNVIDNSSPSNNCLGVGASSTSEPISSVEWVANTLIVAGANNNSAIGLANISATATSGLVADNNLVVVTNGSYSADQMELIDAHMTSVSRNQLTAGLDVYDQGDGTLGTLNGEGYATANVQQTATLNSDYLVTAGGSSAAPATGYHSDYFGTPWDYDEDLLIGAVQPEPAPVEPTPRAPMRMSDLLTPTVSLEADPATVVATATATFYVDFEAGSDGSGTEGSPWNTLAGKEATIDAVVGSVAVVMAGIADGQQIAGLAFSNGSGTDISFISWHLLDGAKTRAHWTPAIKMDRIDTPSMSGSVIDYDLTDIETALAGRGWSGTFDVQAVLSGYTPFTGQTSIPASGLRTLAQDLVTDGAYYESFRRVTGSAKVVWEEVGSAAAVSVADTWHFDGTTDVVRARQATVPDDGYIVYLDDAANQVVTISGWEEPRFLGVRFFLLGDRGDRRFVQATTKRMLLQDIECEGTGAEDTFALLNNAGDANSGLTMRRCQFSGMGKDGNPIVVSTNTTPDYKSWHSIDTISHAGWRYEYTDSVPTGGLQGTDAGILNDQATYFGAPHAGDLEEIRIERGFGFAYNSKTTRLIQSQPNDSPTDYTDISDYKAVLIGLRAEGLSGIDQANVYRRTLVVACNLEGAGSAFNSHLFGRNGNLGEAVGFVACILRGSVSMRSAIALWNTTNAFISRCLFHCDQNGISAKEGANAWTGEVTLDNNLYLFINDNKSWWGIAQAAGEVTATVADSIKDIDGGLEIAEAFENCDFYENTLDHTDKTSADVDATFPDNSNVYDTSMTVPANGAATSANLSTRGIPEIDGVLTVIEGDDVSINGQFHNGTFGPFQYGGFGVSDGGILSRSRLWRSRLQRI
jgi:hypothetical protein